MVVVGGGRRGSRDTEGLEETVLFSVQRPTVRGLEPPVPRHLNGLEDDTKIRRILVTSP